MMGIFKKAEPEPPKPEGGGLALIRARVRAAVRYPAAHAALSREAQISGDTINAFIRGADNLTPEKIAAVLDWLNMKSVVYLPDVDLLKSTAPEPTSAGRPPDRYVPPPQVDYSAPRRPLLSPETPLGSGMLKPADMRKPGWA
jgi:hypothetical protein